MAPQKLPQSGFILGSKMIFERRSPLFVETVSPPVQPDKRQQITGGTGGLPSASGGGKGTGGTLECARHE
jgi:hypothetical protein